MNSYLNETSGYKHNIMKYGLLFAIKIYQIITPPLYVFLAPYVGCRFLPTCSEYTKKAIEKHGSMKGALLGLKRISKCNTFFEGGLDTNI